MNPMPFAALHPTPSRLTSTASSAAASQRTAATAANSSFLSDAPSSPRGEGNKEGEADGARQVPLDGAAAAMTAEEDDDFVNVTSEDAGGADDNINLAERSGNKSSRSMRFVAHRGNLRGPNPAEENRPSYLRAALARGFDVEVDAWYDPQSGQWALGHDGPEYPIEYDFLLQPGVWVHAKNTAALKEMVKDPRVHCFAHDKDEYTLTSRGYIWAYPDVELAGGKCIAVMYSDPESVLGSKEIGGVCHDEVGRLRERYDAKRYDEIVAGRGVEGAADENGDEGSEDDRKPAAIPNFRRADNSGAIDTADAIDSKMSSDNMASAAIDGGDATDNNAGDDHCKDDRKPAAKSSQPAAKPTQSDGGSIVAGDNRFLCAICLETVSDEPVVTRCGHLYCWPCLYQWLQPGMLLSEYRAAFGGGAPTATAGAGGGLNFLSSAYSTHPLHDRPYNPAGRPYNEQRRCCPICKAGCTVDAVVPIYIHVHGGSPLSPSTENEATAASGEGGTMQRGDASAGGSVSRDSLNSLDVDNEPGPAPDAVSQAEGSTSQFATASSAASGGGFDSLEDPTMANLGLRNRRRNTNESNQQQPKRQRQQSATRSSSASDVYICESPTRTQQSALGGSGSNNLSTHHTPVHRNSSAIRDNGNVRGPPNGSSVEVPSRPIPTSAARSTPGQQNPTGGRPDASQPNMNERAPSGMASSSPFRIALRPRHHARALTPPHQGHPFAGNLPVAGQTPGHVPFSRAYANQHHRHGRLTSALLGIVDAVDNLAANQAGAGEGRPQQPAPAVPQLHRSDGGLGGIGRASERNANVEANDLGGGMMNEEDSSLAMAREFLSRLPVINGVLGFAADLANQRAFLQSVKN